MKGLRKETVYTGPAPIEVYMDINGTAYEIDYTNHHFQSPSKFFFREK